MEPENKAESNRARDTGSGSKVSDRRRRDQLVSRLRAVHGWRVADANIVVEDAFSLNFGRHKVPVPMRIPLDSVIPRAIEQEFPFVWLREEVKRLAQARKEDLTAVIAGGEQFLRPLDVREIERAVSRRQYGTVSAIVEKARQRKAIADEASRRGISFHFRDAFSKANRMSRRLIFAHGPTNSGKTHWALHQAMAAGDGMYLGPLRLLALEVRDRLTDLGFPCDLVTGEEVMRVENARFSARTIEMADLSEEHSVVIIDETQFLFDPDRGWAWANAIAGCPAETIILTGPAWAVPAVEQLAGALGLTLELKEFVRQGTLEFEELSDWRSVPDGSIVVGFSREMVLQISDIYRGIGRTPAVIYGSLPPEARREQARLFRSGDRKLLVATDAIGLGLNLPADRVVFWESDKFDGQTFRPLLPAEIQQIGGRAGRGPGATGLVSSLGKRDRTRIRNGLFAPIPPPAADRFLVAPTVEHLRIITPEMENKIHSALLYFEEEIGIEPHFKASTSADVLTLARIIDDIAPGLPVETKWTLVRAPIARIEPAQAFWERAVASIRERKPIPVPEPDNASLEAAESAVKVLDIYLWLSYRFSQFCPKKSVALAHRRRDEANYQILGYLQTRRGAKGKRIECRKCGRALLPFTRFEVCLDCSRRERRNRWEDD